MSHVVSSFSKAVYVSVIALEIGMSILLTDCNRSDYIIHIPS